MTTQTKPIDVYYAATPNGHKVTIMLEELGVPYELKFIRIGRGDRRIADGLRTSAARNQGHNDCRNRECRRHSPENDHQDSRKLRHGRFRLDVAHRRWIG